MRRIFAFLLLMTIMLYGCDSAPEGSGMDMIFFDVGKADCTYISVGESMLIDAGTQSDGESVTRILKEMGVEQIPILMISHFDRDHVGGAAQIIREFQVKKLICPDYMKESDESAACMEMAAKRGVEVITVTSEYTLEIGGAEIKIYPPQKAEYQDKQSNNSSLAAVLTYGENRVLFTGDAEAERIAEITDILDGEYDILKVPHHGVYQDGLQEFFVKVGAEYGIVTSSNKNPEDPETLEALKRAGTEPVLTKDGRIHVNCNGKNITIKTGPKE